MNSWQFFCRIVLVNALPPTTKIVLSYCLSLLTSAMKSLSPLTIANALMWSWVNASSSASSARLISAPFLSPRGEGSRCTICTACSERARVADSCLPQFAYANLVTISPRSFSESSTAATSNSRCRVDLTPISILSKSMNTAILSFCSIESFFFSGRGRFRRCSPAPGWHSRCEGSCSPDDFPHAVKAAPPSGQQPAGGIERLSPPSVVYPTFLPAGARTCARRDRIPPATAGYANSPGYAPVPVYMPKARHRYGRCWSPEYPARDRMSSAPAASYRAAPSPRPPCAASLRAKRPAPSTPVAAGATCAPRRGRARRHRAP